MKTMFRLAFMAMATLYITACTQESMVENPNKKGEEKAIGFSPQVPNMTRAALEEYKTEFGVFTIKTEGSAKFLLMNNYLVKYKSDSKPNPGETWGASDNLTDALSYWYYDGITTTDGAETNQDIKYWDTDASKYDFYAYLDYTNPFSTVIISGGLPENNAINLWYNTVDYSLNYRMSASSIETADPGYTADNYPLMAYAERDATGNFENYNDVSFDFKHFNSKVNIQFYTTITAYDVRITDAIVLRSKTATDKVNTACLAVMNGDEPAVKNPALKILNQSFSNPTPNSDDKLPNSFIKYDAGTSGTTYFCMPSSTVTGKENGDLEVYVKYSLIKDGDTINKEATVLLPKESYTRWEQNKAYLYIFKITPDDLHPIVFDKITISDYDEDDWSYEFDTNP